MDNWIKGERVNASTQQGEPLGGWLYLVAVGMFLGPMANLVHFTELVEAAQRANWSFIWQQGPITVLAILFELGIQGYMLVFSIYLAILFSGRKSKFPRMFIVYVVSLFILGIVGALIAVFIPHVPPSLVGEAMAFPILMFVLGLIWIPYFLRSRRVKKTFVVGNTSRLVKFRNEKRPEPTSATARSPQLGLGVPPKHVAINGWYRIVIAISVAWLLALSVFIGYEHQSRNIFCHFGNDGAVCQHAFWAWAYVSQENFEFTLKQGQVAATALLPIVALWFCLGAAAWVKRGFRTQS